MKRLKIYLDTSVINFLFADDVPEFRKITEDFFENYVKMGKYIVYISDVVIAEIEKTKNEDKKKRLLEVIEKYSIKILTLDKNSDAIAGVYIREKVIPEKKLEDAQHIAIATCNQMDILLSWNFKHLSNIQKQIDVKIVNEKEGYFYPLILTNPMEVVYEND
ncbi:MAG: type II toxin-antitoxin system VapC family toxin [Bacteroidetes bacterium]|nr:type II toxin-antitoxin system VapC family toxin [Bacteroidota bacterium]